jgi:hypothetical protein
MAEFLSSTRFQNKPTSCLRIAVSDKRVCLQGPVRGLLHRYILSEENQQNALSKYPKAVSSSQGKSTGFEERKVERARYRA